MRFAHTPKGEEPAGGAAVARLKHAWPNRAHAESDTEVPEKDSVNKTLPTARAGAAARKSKDVTTSTGTSNHTMERRSPPCTRTINETLPAGSI